MAQFAGDTVLAVFAQPAAAGLAAQDLVALLHQLAEHHRHAEIAEIDGRAGRAACACIGAAVTRARALALTCAQGKRPFLADAGIDAALLPGQPGSDRSA